VTAQAVYDQLAKDFPPSALDWVKDPDVHWSGPQMVPADHIDMADRDEWTASKEPARVAAIGRKLRGAHAKGKRPKPVILVRTPGSALDLVADGHHHVLAELQAGQAIWAYVATTKSDHGGWSAMASQQRYAGTQKAGAR
jgi:hypothetical protein